MYAVAFNFRNLVNEPLNKIKPPKNATAMKYCEN